MLKGTFITDLYMFGFAAFIDFYFCECLTLLVLYERCVIRSAQLVPCTVFFSSYVDMLQKTYETARGHCFAVPV